MPFSPGRWHKACAVLWVAANHFPDFETAEHTAFYLVDETSKYLNSISNSPNERNNFLILTELVVICTYLRKSQTKFLKKTRWRTWSGERPSLRR